jgi:ferredoxin
MRFSASAADTVLQAALKAGIELPSSCRNGTCRACMSRLTEGHIAYQIEWPGLSVEEKLEGYFLPCVACARSDLTMQASAV